MELSYQGRQRHVEDGVVNVDDQSRDANHRQGGPMNAPLALVRPLCWSHRQAHEPRSYRRQAARDRQVLRRLTLWWWHRLQRGDSRLTKSTRTTAPSTPAPPVPAVELVDRARRHKVTASTDQPKVPPLRYRGIDHSELVDDFRLACISRALDDRAITLQRQSRAYFEIAGAGHEALGLAMARSLRPGYDWLFPYYRDQALVLGLGVTPRDILLQAVGSCEDASSGGRQMPAHWGNKSLNIVSQSSCTGSQCLPAVGCAEASRYITRRDLPGCVARDDELTYVSLGEGATSEGEFWESLNTACQLQLPDRVPRRGQRMGHLGSGFRTGTGTGLRARSGLSRPCDPQGRRHRLLRVKVARFGGDGPGTGRRRSLPDPCDGDPAILTLVAGHPIEVPVFRRPRGRSCARPDPPSRTRVDQGRRSHRRRSSQDS